MSEEDIVEDGGASGEVVDGDVEALEGASEEGGVEVTGDEEVHVVGGASAEVSDGGFGVGVHAEEGGVGDGVADFEDGAVAADGDDEVGAEGRGRECFAAYDLEANGGVGGPGVNGEGEGALVAVVGGFDVADGDVVGGEEGVHVLVLGLLHVPFVEGALMDEHDGRAGGRV